MTEIHWLAATVVVTAFFWIVYVLNGFATKGLSASLANPSPDHPPLSAWAQRAKAAHSNAIENLVLFAPLALGVVALGQSSSFTVTCTAVYFFARLAHFIIYVAGIPVLRTIAFALGWAATVALGLVILGIL